MTPGKDIGLDDPRRLFFESKKYLGAQFSLIPLNEHWLLVASYGTHRTLIGEFDTEELIDYIRGNYDNAELNAEAQRRHSLALQQQRSQEEQTLSNIEITL